MAKFSLFLPSLETHKNATLLYSYDINVAANEEIYKQAVRMLAQHSKWVFYVIFAPKSKRNTMSLGGFPKLCIRKYLLKVFRSRIFSSTEILCSIKDFTHKLLSFEEALRVMKNLIKDIVSIFEFHINLVLLNIIKFRTGTQELSLNALNYSRQFNSCLFKQ